MLGEMEGAYAEAVRKAQAQAFDKGDLSWMQLFTVVQHARTEVAAQQMREFYEKSSAIKFRGVELPESERPTMTAHQTVMQSMKQIMWLSPYMKDLTFCIFQNRTPIPFVTSDNPVVNTNRFYCQKIGEDTWGAMSAGALFMLPLGPRLLGCFFDAGVYSVEKQAYVPVHKKSDVLAFNTMQYLNAAENIYFSDPAVSERIATEFEASRERRVKDLARLTEFLAVEMPDGRDRLVRKKSGMDERKFDSKYVQYCVPRPIPARWPSVIPFRINPVAFSNGSAVGYVRHKEWLKSQGRPPGSIIRP